MIRSIRTAAVAVVGFAATLFALPAQAHEAYVLPRADFWAAERAPFDFHAWDALRDPGNLRTAVVIASSVLVLLAIHFFVRLTPLGRSFHDRLERFAFIGPHFVRAAIAAALLLGALSDSFLGPELPISQLPYAGAIRGVLVAASAMIAFGFLTELAAAAALAVFGIAFVTFGSYVLTYANYFGELLVLLLFGLRAFSVDAKLFGKLRRLPGLEKYATTIVRVCYGIALLWAGITVKMLHPDLTQFHWLFPHDPLLVTLGAGIVESVIALFIIFGFEMRLTVLVSLFYITLSLLYFRELVWPHLLLYGISINLLVQPEVFTLDHLLDEKLRLEKEWWKRPFVPHASEQQRRPYSQ